MTLGLPTVTLCAATSVNVSATVAALISCLEQISVARAVLFTDTEVRLAHPGIEVVRIPRLKSVRDYSKFVLQRLGDHIETDHCLIVQWDGFVLDAGRWSSEFLEYDYIGAPWPHFADGLDVGNGGFSLRSKRLIQACRDARFEFSLPEDVAVCRLNRTFLEQEHGLRFADRSVAEAFSFERTLPSRPTFGFHGVFNMIPLFGADRFWEVYSSLCDRGAAVDAYGALWNQLGQGQNAMARRSKLMRDVLGLRLLGDRQANRPVELGARKRLTMFR